MRLDRTTCPKCHKRWPGHKLRSDESECPDCRKRADPENGRARFAPGRRGPLIPAEPDED